MSQTGAVDRTLNATWAIDVHERSGAWLRVTGGNTAGATGLWCRAQDVTPL